MTSTARTILLPLLLTSLAGCGIVQREQLKAALESQHQRWEAAKADCKAQFPTTPTSKNHADYARCMVAYEKTDPPVNGAPDLVMLKETYWVLIMSNVDKGVISAEQGDVQLAELFSRITVEGQRRSNVNRMINAQEQAAFAQSLAAVAAAMPQPRQPTNCTTMRGPVMSSTTCN